MNRVLVVPKPRRVMSIASLTATAVDYQIEELPSQWWCNLQQTQKEITQPFKKSDPIPIVSRNVSENITPTLSTSY